jgi:ferredoxin, 2Fe-2S
MIATTDERTYVRSSVSIGRRAIVPVKFVQRNGSERNVEISESVSVMLAAVRSGIRAIDGERGGSLDCATCRVYVEETQAELLPLPSDEEIELLLNVLAPRKANSRLSCQLKLPPSIDQLVVFIPEVQS